MRTIQYIAVHCTATSQLTSIPQLLQEFRRRGWKNPGYHFVVTPDGAISQILDESLVSNGVKGYNSRLINVAYIGGIDEKGRPVDNRTPEQKVALRQVLAHLHKKYPEAIIQGHRDFSPDLNHNGRIEPAEYIKACPCFDAEREYQDL